MCLARALVVKSTNTVPNTPVSVDAVNSKFARFYSRSRTTRNRVDKEYMRILQHLVPHIVLRETVPTVVGFCSALSLHVSDLIAISAMYPIDSLSNSQEGLV